MFAYCNNCPIAYYDPSGHAANPGANISAINDGLTSAGDGAKVLSVTLYNTELDAVVGFAKKYTTASIVRQSEIGAYIYKLSTNGRENYYFGTVSNGSSSKMTIFAPGMWVDEELWRNSTVVAMIHTHPNPNGDSALFSPEDIIAWRANMSNGNAYIVSHDCKIYIFDRIQQVQQGIFVTDFKPNGIGGNNSPAKRTTYLLL